LLQAGSRNLAATTAGLEPNGLLTFRHLLIVVHQRFACADLSRFTWHCETKEVSPLGDMVPINVARTSLIVFPFLSLSLSLSFSLFLCRYRGKDLNLLLAAANLELCSMLRF